MVEENHKKGTTTVGIVCKSAVILAADKRASLGHLAMHALPKVFKVTDFIALTTAGLVSDAHTLLKYLIAEMDLYKLDKNKDPSIDIAANLLSTILYGGRQSFFPYLVGLLLAGKADDGTFKLYNLEAAGSAIMDKYTVTGSGSELALAILDNEYKDEMNSEEAIKLAIKAIKSATKRDIFTGDGIDLVIIDSKGFRKLEENKIAALAK